MITFSHSVPLCHSDAGGIALVDQFYLISLCDSSLPRNDIIERNGFYNTVCHSDAGGIALTD